MSRAWSIRTCANKYSSRSKVCAMLMLDLNWDKELLMRAKFVVMSIFKVGQCQLLALHLPQHQSLACLQLSQEGQPSSDQSVAWCNSVLEVCQWGVVHLCSLEDLPCQEPHLLPLMLQECLHLRSSSKTRFLTNQRDKMMTPCVTSILTTTNNRIMMNNLKLVRLLNVNFLKSSQKNLPIKSIKITRSKKFLLMKEATLKWLIHQLSNMINRSRHPLTTTRLRLKSSKSNQTP